MDLTGQVLLYGQFLLNKKYAATLHFPEEGTYNTTIKVVQGFVRISHNSYNPDGATWLSPPLDGQKPYYDLRPGTYQLKFNIRKNYDHLDQISMVNVRLRGQTCIHYKFDAAVIQ